MTIALVLSLLLVLFLAACGGLTRWVTAKVDEAVKPQGRFVDIDGYRLHVFERGSGPAILCVHGLCGQMGNFAYLPMEEMAKSHRVVLVDRPGSGFSTRPANASAELKEQARVIAALIVELKLGSPLVVGHSLGGAVALTLALNHPQAVSNLALIAPLTQYEHRVPPLPFLALALPRWLRPLYAHFFAVPLVLVMGKSLVAGIFAPEGYPTDFRIKGGGLLGLRPSAYLEAARDIDDLVDELAGLVARYGTLKVPIGMLFGREDEVLSCRVNGEDFAQRVPATELTLVSGGHMLPVTQATETAEWILHRARLGQALIA